MSVCKRRIIALVLFLLAITFLTFVFLDLANFSQGNAGLEFDNNKFVRRGITVLCLVLVLLIGNDGMNHGDTKRLRLIFLTIFLADLLFMFNIFIPGYILFSICQGLLIWRNGTGLMNSVYSGELLGYKIELVLCGSTIILTVLAFTVFLLYPSIGKGAMIYALLGYGILLGISLWVAISNFILKLFPRKNSILTMLGMICFFISDFAIGFGLAKHCWVYVNFVVWLFYSPALLLIGLSGYKYE